MNEDIIIIIPTKGRQNYLNRVASYYSKFDMCTFICDAYQTKCNMDTYTNVHYLWDPSKGFFEELLDVVNMTNAAFYLLSPDDDFIKYETLASCYEKMQQNPQISMGSGRQMFFDEAFNGRFIYYDYHNKISESKFSFINRNNYCFFQSNYQNIHWSLFRRDCLIDALNILDKSRFNYACFAEFIFGVEGIRHGGIYFDEGVFNFREESIAPHWGSVAPSISLKNYLFDPALRSDINKLKSFYNKKDWLFVRNNLIMYCFAPYFILKRIKAKIKHMRFGYYKLQQDVVMERRISDAYGKMKR